MTKSMKRSIPSLKQPCEAKRELRRRKATQIQVLEPEYIAQSDAEIARRLLLLEELKSAERVFIYCSVGREVATQDVIKTLLREGKRVALPVSGTAGEMVFYPVSDMDELRPGRFGIPEPPVTQKLIPQEDDIIIVPALCCDEQNFRLGHGMGYYDRFLAESSAFTVCLCRKRLLEKRIPTQETDIPVSLVLTE